MTEVVAIDSKIVLSFIEKYRELENMPLTEGYRTISKIIHESQVDHLCNQWRNKKRDFASFYLNLSTKTQIKLLNLWGITDVDDTFYFSQCETDRMFSFFQENAPRTAQQLHRLVLFFNNNAVDSITGRSFVLNQLPKPGKQFGNSKNWGNYLLGVKEPEAVVQYVLNYALNNLF